MTPFKTISNVKRGMQSISDVHLAAQRSRIKIEGKHRHRSITAGRKSGGQECGRRERQPLLQRKSGESIQNAITSKKRRDRSRTPQASPNFQKSVGGNTPVCKPTRPCLSMPSIFVIARPLTFGHVCLMSFRPDLVQYVEELKLGIIYVLTLKQDQTGASLDGTIVYVPAKQVSSDPRTQISKSQPAGFPLRIVRIKSGNWGSTDLP